jgi:type I restriction enzyme R subunit
LTQRTFENQAALVPLYEVGTRSVRDEEKIPVSEIIARVNELFNGELSGSDKLVYVKNVIKGKLLDSDILRKQAKSNTKVQFDASPDLPTELVSAIIDGLDVHEKLSTQALNSDRVRAGLKEILLGPGQLYESVREDSANGSV